MSLPREHLVSIQKLTLSKALQKQLHTDCKYSFVVTGQTYFAKDKLKTFPNCRWEQATKSWYIPTDSVGETLLKLRSIFKNIKHFPHHVTVSTMFDRMCSGVQCENCGGVGITSHSNGFWIACEACSEQVALTNHLAYYEVPDSYDKEEEQEISVRLLRPESEDWDM